MAGENEFACLNFGHDVAENVSDCGPQKSQNHNDDYSDKNQNECILNKTLSFFSGGE